MTLLPPVIRRVFVLGLAVVLCQAAHAAPAYLERHEGPQNSWALIPNRFGIVASKHQRVRQQGVEGDFGAEYFELQGPPGYSAMLLTRFGEAPVLDDLVVRVRAQSDQPGVLVAVRVVYPRATDPRTGGPLAAIVRGDQRLEAVDTWQTLVLDGLVTRARRHARVLTGQLGKQVDDREAFVDAVALIAPSSPRGVNLWVDELSIDGLVRRGAGERTPEDTRQPPAVARVGLDRSGMTIDGRPFYPRVITHRGDAPAELKKLGFNTIAFDSPPTVEQLVEADRLGLKVICPPPALETLRSPAKAARWSPVILWRLGGEQDRRSLDSATAEVERLRRADGTLARPILATPTESWDAWSRLADGLVIRAPWGPATAMTRLLRERLDEAARFAEPGAPLLAVIPVTHSHEFMQQATTFAPAGAASPWRLTTQFRTEAETAALRGATGVWFSSESPVTSGDGERVRLALALVNLRLALLEPWLRDGARGANLPSEAHTRPAVMYSRGRTWLIVPDPSSPRMPATVASYVAPGIAESVKAYEITPAGVRPVGMTRTTGGARVTASTADAMLLLTDDQRAIAEVRSRVGSIAARGLALEQKLAAAELRHTQSRLPPLALASRSATPESAMLTSLRRWISHSKTAQSTGDSASAYRYAVHARRELEAWNRGRLLAANPTRDLVSSPLAGHPDTLIDHARLLKLVEPLTRGPNLLAGGDFEDQSRAVSSGWRYVAREATDAAPVVSFSAAAPADGQRSLSIHCPAASGATSDASVLIRSPEVALRGGELIEVTGRVKVESLGEQGWLGINDTLGGEELGLVLQRRTEWRTFRLLRRPDADVHLRVSFTARGEISAQLDAVMVRTIELPTAAKAAVLGAPALQRK